MNKYIKKTLTKSGYQMASIAIFFVTLFVSCAVLTIADSHDDVPSELAVATLSEEVDTNFSITRFNNVKDSYALTIECETSNSDIDEILKLLDEHNVKASFFVTGIWAEKYKDDVRLIESKGHDICCHGFTHLKLSSIDKGRAKEELKRFKICVSEILGKNEWNGSNCFRAPYSECDENIIKYAGEQGFQVYNDEINALDWKNDISTVEIVNNLKENLLPGDILTLHSGHTKSPAVLAELLKFTKESNLTAKSLSEITQIN